MDSVLAIYPTAHKVEDLLKRQSRAKGILLGHRLVTFPQVTDSLWRESSVGRVTVGPMGEWLALEEALNRTRLRGIALPFIRGAGSRDHLLGFIRELKSAAVDANDLRQACAVIAGEASERLRAVAEIFAEYDAVLSDRGAADAHDRERLVLEWMHRVERDGRRPRLLEGVERLLVAEIYDPSLLQFMLVSSLIRLIGDAVLTIQAEPFELRIHRFAELTWNRFVAEQSIGDQVLPHFARRGGRKGRLGFALAHLFTRSTPKAESQEQMTFPFIHQHTNAPEFVNYGNLPPQDGSVRIIEAANPRREAEDVARAIRLMMEMPAAEQVPLDRIGIVARNLAVYRDHLEAAFHAYRIPLSVLQPRALSAFAPARVVREVLRIPLTDYHRDNLLSLCRAPFLKFPASRYEQVPARAGYIDRKTRPLAACIESRRTELVRALERNTADTRVETLRRQVALLERAAPAWDELLELLAPLERPSPIAAHVVRTLRVLDRLAFDPLRESLTDSSAAAAGPLLAAFDLLAKEANLVAPERAVTLEEFASLLDQILDESAVKSIPDQMAGGVRAMAVADARGLDFDWVFIIGLNDGVFPRYQAENPLVPDDAIRSLNAPLRGALRRHLGKFAPDAPGPILRTHDDRNLEELFLFFLAMSMPTRAVVLSYSTADSSGNPLAVSAFVEEVRRVLSDMLPECTGVTQFIPPASQCFAPAEFIARAALDSLLPPPSAGLFAEAVDIESILRRTEAERRREQYFALPTREELVRQRRRLLNLPQDAAWLAVDLSPDEEKLASANAYDGRVTFTPALARFLLQGSSGGPRAWSAAQLTELAACGYKFFAGRILRLPETDEIDHEPTALETGTLVHQILCETFNRSQPWDPPSLRSCAQEVCNDFYRVRRLASRDPAFFDVDWQSIKAMVNEIIEHEIRHWAGVEARPEMRHEFPFRFLLAGASSLSETGGEITIGGQIDRLEIYRESGRITRLKLIDYKASRRLSDYAELLKPKSFACEDLQMPVYAAGAMEHFREEMAPQPVVQVGYIALKNRDKETASQTIPPALLGNVTETAGRKTVATRVIELVGGAVAGHFDVDPLECSDYCRYRRVCRYRKAALD